MTDLSIIIVSYKGYGRLRQCLDSLKTFRGETVTHEIIVVNNCPGDETFGSIEIQYPQFRFISNVRNGGYANGCNLGAASANGRYLLILNPDTVVTEMAIEALLRTAESDPSFMITSCRQINERGKESIAWGAFPRFRNLTGTMRTILGTGYKNQIKLKEGFSPDLFSPDWISGSVVLISREDNKRLKGFDEDFWMYFEDVDLCRRARNLGGEIVFCNNITIEHNHGGSSRINLATASLTKAEVLISKHIYFSKHTSGIHSLLIQSFLVVNNLICFGVLAIGGAVFFFIPKLFLRSLIFIEIIRYYSGAVQDRSWKSPRSVNNI